MREKWKERESERAREKGRMKERNKKKEGEKEKDREGESKKGYNNHFRIFFNKGTLCQRITYYFTSTILSTLFGWLQIF